MRPNLFKFKRMGNIVIMQFIRQGFARLNRIAAGVGRSTVTALAVFMLAGCGFSDITTEQTRFSVPSSPSVFHGFNPDTSLVAVGDSVVIAVWGFPEFATRSIVKPTGTFTVPMIGEMLGAGLRHAEIAEKLRERLSEFIKGDIRLSLDITHPPSRITVLGSVARAGSFPSEVDLSLLEVLASVGGWTEEADLRYVRLNRVAPMENEEPVVIINLAQLMESGNSRLIPYVHPGDVVIVARQENPVRQASDFLRDAVFLLGFFRIFN